MSKEVQNSKSTRHKSTNKIRKQTLFLVSNKKTVTMSKCYYENEQMKILSKRYKISNNSYFTLKIIHYAMQNALLFKA